MVIKAITIIILIIEVRLGLLSLKYKRKSFLINSNVNKLYQTSIGISNIIRANTIIIKYTVVFY